MLKGKYRDPKISGMYSNISKVDFHAGVQSINSIKDEAAIKSLIKAIKKHLLSGSQESSYLESCYHYLGMAYRRLFNKHTESRNYDAAASLSRKYIETYKIFDIEDCEDLRDAYDRLAFAYERMGYNAGIIQDFKEAVLYFEQMMDACLMTQNENKIIEAERKLMSCYIQFRQQLLQHRELDEAIHYQIKIVKICKMLCDKNEKPLITECTNLIEYYKNHGNFFFNKKEYEKALACYLSAEQIIINEFGETSIELQQVYEPILDSYYHLMLDKSKKKDNENCNRKYIAYLHKFVDLLKRHYGKYCPKLLECYDWLATAYQSVEKYDSVIQMRENIVEIAMGKNDRELAASSYQTIMSIYNNLGNKEKAQEYMNKIVNLFD